MIVLVCTTFCEDWSTDFSSLTYALQIAELEKTKQKLTEQLSEETSSAAFLAQHTVEKHKLILCEQKVRDLEAKLDLEVAQKQRLEVSCPFSL